MEPSFKIKKILVSTDFSGYSRVAFPKAIALARKFEASISLLHVIQPVITPSEYTWGVQPVELQREHEQHCHSAIKKLISEQFPADLKVAGHILHGIPFKEIINFSRDEKIDLIVISTHGLSGISHIIFGSTAEKIVRKSVCPVLVVRDPAHKFEMP
ncbi:MAG: universal stress protein [Candidatus Marinimicrobia bacterium]|nr:universal stress protein [Candidatus Neomarinimicrobiota bacterium]